MMHELKDRLGDNLLMARARMRLWLQRNSLDRIAHQNFDERALKLFLNHPQVINVFELISKRDRLESLLDSYLSHHHADEEIPTLIHSHPRYIEINNEVEMATARLSRIQMQAFLLLEQDKMENKFNELNAKNRSR